METLERTPVVNLTLVIKIMLAMETILMTKRMLVMKTALITG